MPTGVVAGIAGAWALAAAATTTGKADLLDHDVIAERAVPLWLSVAVFLIGWQVMVAAMMLPSTIPLLRLFASASASQPGPRAALGAFVGGYAVVWGIFGSLALIADLAFHKAVHAAPGLERQPELIAGGVLVVAGAFQFSDLKDRCLRECRHPALWLRHHYRRGTAVAFDLGRQHGLFCLGCCWALMLLMFAVGVTNLLWMSALAALMAYEKIGRHGVIAGRIAGYVLIAWGLAVAVQPPWLPDAIGGR